jgi:DNA-binding NtrC family response regulator
MKKILIGEDDALFTKVLSELIKKNFEEVKISTCPSTEVLQRLSEERFSAIIYAPKPQEASDELIQRVIQQGKKASVCIATTDSSFENVVRMMKLGAFEVVNKPPELNRLLTIIRNSLDRTALIDNQKMVNLTMAGKYEIVGESDPVIMLKKLINKVAPSESRVLITGPNGAGKELVARAIHGNSGRANGPFIEVNCAAIPSELIESELFGHEKGSFTSAIAQKIGKFECAEGGTLFLDEIGDMSHSAQTKLLRALQERKITRVGGNKDIELNVRVIAATNKNLIQEIARSNFREDLYHRINIVELQVPSLNERKTDIPLLIDKFLNDIARENKQPRKEITVTAIDLLMNKDWTGNIRELRNNIERLILLGDEVINETNVRDYVKGTQREIKLNVYPTEQIHTSRGTQENQEFTTQRATSKTM